MAANPALIARQDGTFLPAPFQGEYIALARPGVEFSIDNIRSRSGKCASLACVLHSLAPNVS